MSNNNVFYATNPAKMADALWRVMMDSGVDVADMLIFLPSRRAVRTVEKFIVDRVGGAAILPRLVALGSGVDDADLDAEQLNDDNVISNTERVVVLAKLLAADTNVCNLATALTLAHDLVRMQDYMENEGVEAAQVDWDSLIDEQYSEHFQKKAKILKILSEFMPVYANGRMTSTCARNRDIRQWGDVIGRYPLVIVCASTASVPATADLMAAVAKLPQGRIILSGKIAGRIQDFQLNTNPYNAEFKFLQRLQIGADDVQAIDVGESAIDFMNWAFGNDCDMANRVMPDLSHVTLVECKREATEANVVAEIAQRAIQENKSVLVITPDAAGNQRIDAAFQARGLVADFSGGVPGKMTNVGRALLNLMDEWIDAGTDDFDKIYAEAKYNLFDTVAKIVEQYMSVFAPQFVVDDTVSVQVWRAIRAVSDAAMAADLRMEIADARAFIADAIATVSARLPMNDDAKIVVLGTIESRMQTADVVILTGLNDGMFPAQGYENDWLPRRLAEKIGLPSPDRKVSLQALDFMNLSCGKQVYWLRSTVSGGVQTVESRFLSRVIARGGNMQRGDDILKSVLQADVVPERSLDYSVPTPPADWSDVYVTELEHLIHNPYSFYVKHILRLSVAKDYWEGPNAIDFGNLVHGVIEDAKDWRPDALVAEMDRRALDILGAGSIAFHFWHKRFLEIAPVVARELSNITNAQAEVRGKVQIAGRNVCAYADRIWDGVVMDIKTGAVPSNKQLELGNMPQLPLEAYMMQQGGFPIEKTSKTIVPTMMFLQLQNNNVDAIKFTEQETQQLMQAAVDKVTNLFNIYSAGGAGYKYEETGDQKYKMFDDLARVRDL